MAPLPPPPLPAAPALTLAAADQWRSARVWRRLESRWLALLPVLTVVLAGAADELPAACDRLNACAVPYGEGLAQALLLAELLVLLVRPRGSFAVPALVGPALWLLPDALPGTAVRTAALLAHLAVAAALYRVATGRRRARAQLASLMGPPVPYPWTLLGGEEPNPRPAPPRLRRLLAALLGTGALLLAASGWWTAAEQDARAQTADEVRATVRAVRDDGARITVDYQLPSSTRTFSTDIEVWWDWEPKTGDTLALLADGTGWHRVAGETYDPAPWWSCAALAGAAAALLLGSAHRTDRARHAPADGAPALRVRVRPEPGGPAVLPVDGGDGEPALWRLVRPGQEAHFAPADEDGPAEWLPDDPPPAGPEPAAATPAEAAARLAGATRPVEALLYHGPDGPYRQLLVHRLPEDPESWRAVGTAAHPAPPRSRAATGLHEDTLAVPAAAAPLLAEDLADPDALPEPARVHGPPAALRLAAAPVGAVVTAVAVTALDDGGFLDGLARPLVVGLPFLLAVIGACGWQLAVDRDGVAVSGALLRRRLPWAQVTAAAVHRGRFTVQAADARQIGFGSWPAERLHRHFGGDYDPRHAARTITLLAHAPERRPTAPLPADAVGRALPLNRLAVAGYLAWTLGHWYFG
ncbi:hypothetical protein ACIQBJ_23165 [Kitasatospora sp. NPDC088391]|uniref:hypothetical protein n=1 Tax=Kitasatospora sp. NPDC088391 TaxID=3364074 RepID=UPI0038149B93